MVGFRSAGLSQATGNWGKQPGPVVRAIWPFDVLLDHPEDLLRSPRATPQASIDAERSADKTVDAVSDKSPLLWYSGLVDTAATKPKEAAKAAKALCKANREEIKALRKQQRK